MLILYMLRSA